MERDPGDPCMTVSRRDVLRRLGAAGAGTLVGSQRRGDAQAAKPLEMAVSEVSAKTVRITLTGLDGQRLEYDGSLVRREWRQAARIRSGEAPQTVRCGELV